MFEFTETTSTLKADVSSFLGLRDGSRPFSQLSEEMAYNALSAAAKWARLRRMAGNGDDEVIPELENLSMEEKVQLVKEATAHAKLFSLPTHFGRILETDCLSPEELGEVEHVLSQIAELEDTTGLVCLLVRPRLSADRVLFDGLLDLRLIIAKLVKSIESRPDIAAVASRALLGHRVPVFRANNQPADWFTRFRAMDVEPSLEMLKAGRL